MTPDQRRVHTADEQFSAGRFQAAEKICRELWEDNFRSPTLTALLADLLLLSNRNVEAEPLLQRAISEQGGNPRLIHASAECHRRSDRLREAADIYRKLGRVGFAYKLERLANGGWYLLPEDAAANVPWAAHADLPLVEARVNGVEGHFLLDTGVGVERRDLPGMLMGHFRLEQQFGFHIGGLQGDGFVNAGALTLDFGTMRVMLQI